MRRAKHRAGGRRGLVFGSIIVAMLAVGQAGMVLAGAVPPVDTPAPSSVEDVQPSVEGVEPVIVDTPSSNDGGGDTSAGEVTDQLPPVVPSVDAETGCPEDVGLETCVPDETDAGASIPVRVTEAVDEPSPPDLQVSKTSDADGILDDGDDLVYTITVTNAGDEKATGVEVVDVLPPGATGGRLPTVPDARRQGVHGHELRAPRRRPPRGGSLWPRLPRSG